MDYIREFDIRLDKEYYYPGEYVQGAVILDTVENFKLRTIRILLRGKAHAEWKVLLSGDRRTVKDDQYFVDERQVIWGEKNLETTIPILPRGTHKFPFRFSLPESSLPCSFESKPCCIRYYLKVTIDIPYASPPQGMKYFTVIGPHIDCMDEQYLKPVVYEDRRSTCCWCCKKGTISLRCVLERSAYVCKESIKLKATIDNQSDEEVKLRVKLEQFCEFFIDRGVLGVSKDLKHLVFEYRGSNVKPRSRSKWDSANSLVIPPMPTTLVGICRLVQIYYVLSVSLDSDKDTDVVQVNFPVTIATVPFRIPNTNKTPTIKYGTRLLSRSTDGARSFYNSLAPSSEREQKLARILTQVFDLLQNTQAHMSKGGSTSGPSFCLGKFTMVTNTIYANPSYFTSRYTLP